MSLVRNATLFTERVSKAPISGNIDNPEGGLDALMQVWTPCICNWHSWTPCIVQVLVCGDRIGWRPESRRVVVYTTDQVQYNHSVDTQTHWCGDKVWTPCTSNNPQHPVPRVSTWRVTASWAVWWIPMTVSVISTPQASMTGAQSRVRKWMKNMFNQNVV